MAAAKKVKVPRRPKTGLAAAPKDNFERCKYYFHYEIASKDVGPLVKAWIKQEFSKEDAKSILANPEYQFTMFSHWAATIFWMNEGLEFDEKNIVFKNKIRAHYEKLIEPGNHILKQKKEVEQQKTTVIRLTPQQLMARKINETIMTDIDELEDAWIEGKKETIDVYALFKKHDLKPMAVPQVRQRVEGWLEEYSGAYNKTDEQLVEGFSHIARTELKRRIKACEDMIADLDRIVQAGKATRKPRVKKAKAADKQIAQLKYQKEDADLKIVSVNPVTVIGATRLIVINSKYRTVTEYITSRREGFEIKGTTLQGVDFDQSRTKTMRKPDEFIPLCHKTVRQFGKAFDALTTKESKPTGRINTDCVLLKVDK